MLRSVGIVAVRRRLDRGEDELGRVAAAFDEGHDARAARFNMGGLSGTQHAGDGAGMGPDLHGANRHVDLAVPLLAVLSGGGLDVELRAQVDQRRRTGVDRETAGHGRVGPHAEAADHEANAVGRVDFQFGRSAEDRDGAGLEHDFGLSRRQIELLPRPEAASQCRRALADRPRPR